MIGRNTPRCRLLGTSCGLALATALMLQGTAAGSFAVEACGPSAVNNSWVEHRTAPSTHLRTFTACHAGSPDPYDWLDTGIGVSDVLWGGELPPGGELRGESALY